jgi:predicted metalloprotease
VTAALRRLASVSAVVIVAMLAGAGCGSSEQTQSTASPTATPAEQGDALGRLPEVPEATGSTRPPASADGTGGSAFLRGVFDDVQAMWREDFQAAGVPYTPATMTLFRDEIHTACGTQSADVGPFYCPADHGVYLDTRFFDALARKAGVSLGDFAQAFVIAHEVAHHVQTLLGILQRVRAADDQNPRAANARSVRLELQADCLAGVWKHSSYQRGQVSQADFEDALRAAAVVGSDFQQHLATGTIIPEDWTHGSSQQRQHWLTTGFEQGKPAACDTFAA